MSCASCYLSVAKQVSAIAGTPPTFVVADHCPKCGKFMGTDGVCQNCSGNLAASQIGQMGGDQAIAIAPPIGDALTPITADLKSQALAASRNGVGLLLGGDDIEDMSATWYAYAGASTAAPGQSLLVCKVRADLPLTPGQSSAEVKLLEAITTQSVKLKTVQEQVTKSGLLPPDEEQQISAKLIKCAKSLNGHLKPGGDGVIQPYVTQHLAEVKAALDTLDANDPPAGVTQAQLGSMTAHYRDVMLNLQEAIAAGVGAGKAKLKFVESYQGTYATIEEKQVPVTDKQSGPGLPATLTAAQLPNTTLITGQPQWQGWTATTGKHYKIDLGSGWEARYHPHDNSSHFAMQGTLMIVPPPGVTDAAAAVAQLRKLNLHSYLASSADAEYLYLNRQAWSLGITGQVAYAKIASGQAQDEAARADEIAAGMLENVDPAALTDLDEVQQRRLAEDILLRAQHATKLERIDPLRKFVAKAIGTTPDQMISSPTYLAGTTGQIMSGHGETQPGGFHVWHRLDANLLKQYHGKRFVTHDLTGEGWANLVACIKGGGVLYSTTRRHSAGIDAGSTMSPEADMHSGGAAYFFCRMRASASSNIAWDYDTLGARSDWFSYGNDHYGAINPKDGHFAKGALTRSISETAGNTGSNNEIMFKNGISLVDYPPARINTPTPLIRNQVLAAFKERGITHLGGKKVEDIVK